MIIQFWCLFLKKEVKKLSITLLAVWTFIIIYLVLYYTIPAVSDFIDSGRNALAIWAASSENIGWMLSISFLISFLGSASIGIPIPFALVLL